MQYGDHGHRRRSMEVMSQHLQDMEHALAQKSGPPLTRLNAKRNLLVVRGPDWRWGEDDGGAGNPGMILTVDEAAGTAAVHWQKSGITRDCYSLDSDRGDLCLKAIDMSSRTPPKTS